MRTPASSRKSGFTLVELLIVMAIIAVLVVPAFINYLSSIRNQELLQAGEQLAEQVRLAHVSSREFREEKQWGVKGSASAKTYFLVSSDEGVEQTEKTFQLPSSVTVGSTFATWFTPSGGDLVSGLPQEVITLNSSNSKHISVTILKSGLVEVSPVQ